MTAVHLAVDWEQERELSQRLHCNAQWLTPISVSSTRFHPGLSPNLFTCILVHTYGTYYIHHIYTYIISIYISFWNPHMIENIQ